MPICDQKPVTKSSQVTDSTLCGEGSSPFSGIAFCFKQIERVFIRSVRNILSTLTTDNAGGGFSFASSFSICILIFTTQGELGSHGAIAICARVSTALNNSQFHQSLSAFSDK